MPSKLDEHVKLRLHYACSTGFLLKDLGVFGMLSGGWSCSDGMGWVMITWVDRWLVMVRDIQGWLVVVDDGWLGSSFTCLSLLLAVPLGLGIVHHQ